MLRDRCRRRAIDHLAARCRRPISNFALRLSASISSRFSWTSSPASVIVGPSVQPNDWAAKTRPWPAMMVAFSSIKAGLVQPKRRMTPASCTICSCECLRAFCGWAFNSVRRRTTTTSGVWSAGFAGLQRDAIGVPRGFGEAKRSITGAF